MENIYLKTHAGHIPHKNIKTLVLDHPSCQKTSLGIF